MKQELIDKYNIPVPRYTSYPPANFFKPNFNEETYRQVLIESNNQNPKEISFYFHIPFCQQLCHYCGCNSCRAHSPELREKYLKTIHKEIDLVSSLIDNTRQISQIHYGGGTPTILSPEELQELNDHLFSRFQTIERPEIAIECHPAYIDENGWKKLIEVGFNRMSLGIQDFNIEVLNAVHRKPSLLPEEEIVKLLHEKGVKVNMDFLYGLPHQTPESMTKTIRRAIEIGPDRLVTFSYAHLPKIFPRQAALDKEGLPSIQQKSLIFETISSLLTESGYKTIGMDHFVREDDELYEALKNGKLYRNFQGYCTRRTTGQVYAFGITGITQLSNAYVQNIKDLDLYMETVENGKLPSIKGYILSPKEQITRALIEMLMCNYMIDWNELSNQLGLSIKEIKDSVEYNDKKLEEFATDGLIEFDDNMLKMTSEGTLFVRNVAASFDSLMNNTDKSFSKPV